MSVPVPIESLREELEQRHNSGYLLTVGESGRPHCVAVALAWSGDELTAGAGRTSVGNAGSGRGVALLCPPWSPESEGYSLIVDVEVIDAVIADGNSSVTLQPTHAVLHRPAVAPDGSPAHDCVHVYDAAG